MTTVTNSFDWDCNVYNFQVIVLWTANTERFCDVTPGLNTTAEELLNSIQNNEEEVSPSTIFAVASILEGCTYINGSPQNTFVPGTDCSVYYFIKFDITSLNSERFYNGFNFCDRFARGTNLVSKIFNQYVYGMQPYFPNWFANHCKCKGLLLANTIPNPFEILSNSHLYLIRCCRARWNGRCLHRWRRFQVWTNEVQECSGGLPGGCRHQASLYRQLQPPGQ